MPYPRYEFESLPSHILTRKQDCCGSLIETSYEVSTYTREVNGWVLEYPLSYYRKNRIPEPRNPYTKSVLRVYHPNGEARINCVNPTCNGGFISGGPIRETGEHGAGHLFSENVTQRAINDAIEKANQGINSISDDVGQRHQVYDTVVGTARRLGEAVKALRHGDLAAVARQLSCKRPGSGILHVSDIGAAWLQLKYGWMPLLNDVYSVMAALDPLNNVTAFVARGYAKEEVRQGSVEGPNSSGYTHAYEVSSLGSCRCELKYEVDDTALLHASQLGLFNPISLAWELLPFSFIVDWFYPIGNYFEGLGLIGATFLGGSTSLKGKTVRKESENWFDTPWNFVGDTLTGSQQWGFDVFSLTRTLINDTPTAVPVLQNPWSASHGFTMAALLSQYLSPFK